MRAGVRAAPRGRQAGRQPNAMRNATSACSILRQRSSQVLDFAMFEFQIGRYVCLVFFRGGLQAVGTARTNMTRGRVLDGHWMGLHCQALRSQLAVDPHGLSSHDLF